MWPCYGYVRLHNQFRPLGWLIVCLAWLSIANHERLLFQVDNELSWKFCKKSKWFFFLNLKGPRILCQVSIELERCPTSSNVIVTQVFLASSLNYKPCHIISLKWRCSLKESDHMRLTYQSMRCCTLFFFLLGPLYLICM